ncbi:MAG: hypothetical protein LBD82_07775, partial [Deltaproteobacteria bacterium]|nr:hypothetical protein [Deltaproteobacteria bacterium]
MRETLKNIFFGSYFRLAAFCVGLAALPIFLALASNEIFTHRQRAELIFNLAVDLSAATHAQQRDLEADITAMLKALGRNNAVYNGYEATKDASFQRALIAWGLSNLVDNLVLYSASGESKAWSTTVPRPLDERFKGIFNRGIISDDVIISHADNAEELLFVLPLRNSLGGVYSFLVASVGLGHYLDLIRDINMNGMFNVVLYAQDGHWLLADEKTRSEYLMALSSRHSGAMSYNAEYADMLRRLVPSSGNSAVIISNADGQRFIAAFSHLRVNLADSSYLSTVLLADYGKFFADLRNNLWRSLIWLSTAFGIMSLIILVSCLYFFKHPLRKLLDVSRRLSEGDLSAAAELSVINGAFAEYAHGLQNIAESLQKREEELSCARRNAELSTQYKTEFFANISHEIRTPMNAILGMTYLVLKSDLSPMQMDYINKIQTSGKNLLHIINDILDFSKLEDGDISMESSLFSIRDVFTFISGNYSRRLREKNIHLVTDIASDTPLTLT